MTNHSRLLLLIHVVGLGFLVAPTAPVQAQVGFGGLYGSVTDAEGTELPGVSISLDGPGATQLQISNAQGRFRFPRLDPGSYTLKAELDGYSPLEQANIDIRAGRETTLVLQISAAIAEAISVVAESPLLDERKISQRTLVSEIDLEKIPTAGDPYAILNQAPGVMVDRIDTGGSRNDRTRFTAPGTRNSQNDFLIDGVQITDMSTEGGGWAHMYFDLEQFDQVDLTTGGNDLSKATAGVSVNLVTKRGTNEYRGSARYLVTDEDLFWFFKQSEPDVDPDDFPPGQDTEIQSTEINNITNFGIEGGGPAIPNRMWLWGSYNRNYVSETSVGGNPRDNFAQQIAGKLNAQLADNNSLVGSLNHSMKIDDKTGFRATRSLESSRRIGAHESALFGDGVALLKLEDSHVFSPRLFLTGTWSFFDGGWSLVSNGCFEAGSCESATETLWDSDRVWQNSFLSGWTERPATEWKIDGSYFLGTGRTSHELKFGGRYREFESSSSFHWPGGRDVFHFSIGSPDFGYFFAKRGVGPPVNQDYTSFWAQDTMTIAKWTVNAGLRYDLQRGKNPAFDVPANPAVPEDLPAVTFEGNDGGGFDWGSLLPRLGVTYALGQERQTLLRASYSRFASALSRREIARLNPVSEAYATYFFLDANSNEMWDGPEEDYFQVGFDGYDPTNPTDLSTPNQTDPNLQPELTDEIILGVEHSIRPELVVGLNATWRNTTGILENRDYLRECETPTCDSGTVRVARREDYVFYQPVEVIQPNGQPYTVDYYQLDPTRFQFNGGDLLLNGDREVDYLGASLTLTKRLSNQWMLRGFLNFGRPTWNIPDSFYEFDDPTDADAYNNDGYDNDGDLFAEAGGRFGQLVMHSTWSFNLNGMYQIAPDRLWGFNVAGNIYGREGYPIPLYTDLTAEGNIATQYGQAMASADGFRYQDIYTVDLRVEKDFAAWGQSSFILSADVFNALNAGTVVQREAGLNYPQANYVLETLSPRIWRLGVRVNWR